MNNYWLSTVSSVHRLLLELEAEPMARGVMCNVVETADWWDPRSLGGALCSSRLLAMGNYWADPRLSGGCMD